MTIEIRPLLFKPHPLSGLSEKLLGGRSAPFHRSTCEA
jgi:hypothetical protein